MRPETFIARNYHINSILSTLELICTWKTAGPVPTLRNCPCRGMPAEFLNSYKLLNLWYGNTTHCTGLYSITIPGKTKMTADEILNKFKATLRDSYGIDISGLDAKAKLAAIGIDSLLLVNIMLDIETDLGFNFESMNLPPDPTLGDVSQAIFENLNKVK
jgi:acyl carrier protein